ncbi:MAG: 4'-phosphopantetheinyl transferase superfamily protein [Sphingobacteriia bacterium]|jgi:4'-phosphopantetheinyl transferase
MREAKFTCSFIQPKIESLDSSFPIALNSASSFIIDTNHFLGKLDYCKSVLNEQDLIYASSKKKESDQQQKIIARAILKILLAKALKQSVHTIEIAKDANGKPFCPTAILSNIHFNISDAANYVAIIIAQSVVGIDIETIQPQFQYQDIASLHFHQNEIQALKNANDPLMLFYRYWTRKESFLKLEGNGLTDYLNELDMTEGEKINKIHGLGPQGNYFVSSFFMNAHLMVSVSVPSLINQLRFFNYIANDLE